MSLFEFLMVFVSLIVGLGVAEILTGIAKQIRARASCTGYWVHSCGVGVIFLALLQAWWELWDLHSIPEWTFYSLVLMLISPAVLYLIAHLIFPEPMHNSNFRQYYYGPMRSIWWLAIFAAASSTLFRPIAFGNEFLTWDNLTSALMMVGFILLVSSKNPVLHSILVPSFLVLLVWDVVRWHPTFSPT